jgi:hypothetical protein
MHPSPSSGRIALAALAAIILTACSASPAPSGSAAPPSLAPSAPLVALASHPASVAPAATPAPTVTPTPDTTRNPTESPDPTPIATPRPTPIPGCGTGRAGLFAHNGEVPETLHFGFATIEYTSISVSMRDGSYDASDSVPGGIGLTPDESAVVVAPGAHIILRADGLTLTGTVARVVPWSTVTFDDLASSPATPEDLPWRLRTDGSISVSAPIVVGDYEVEFFPAWVGTCIAGSGAAYSRIKVR